jgi:hypothetical protein
MDWKIIIGLLLPLSCAAQFNYRDLAFVKNATTAAAETTAPLLLATSSVDSTGTNWLLRFNENVYTNASLAGLVAPSNSALGTITNLTFVTGSGSNALHFYNSPQITSNGVVTYVSFTNAANAIEDLAGNDLASTNVVSVVNNSTVGAGGALGIDFTNAFSTMVSTAGTTNLGVTVSAANGAIVAGLTVADIGGTPGLTGVSNSTSGTSFTLITNCQSSSATAILGAYRQLNPPTGSNNIVFYWTSSSTPAVTGVAIALTNVNQTTPIANYVTNRVASATSLATSITSASGRIVLGFASAGSGFTAENSKVIARLNLNTDTGGGNGDHVWTNGATTISLSYTIAGADSIQVIAVDVQP